MSRQQMHSSPSMQHAAQKKSKCWRIVFWVALVVCVASLVALGTIVYMYWHADHTYKDIAENAFDTQQTTQQTTLADMTVDWSYLRSVNPDVVAWVYIPGTNVNYPVVHTDDNDTYLATSFNGERPFGVHPGTIFLDAGNNSDFSDANNVMYGHHMDDGSMFASLSTQLTNQDEFNSHRTVYVLTPNMNYACTTFSLVLTTGWDLLVETSFGSADSRTAYIQDKEDRSVVQPSEGMPVASSITKLFTLSTCDYTQNNGRAVLFSAVTDSVVPHSADATAINPDDANAVNSAVKEAA
jgi:sortase B